MTKYVVNYWQKESVWCRRQVIFESDTQPTAKNMEYILVNNPTVDYVQQDYDWETSETEDYDFETDFEVEELENEEN